MTHLVLEFFSVMAPDRNFYNRQSDFGPKKKKKNLAPSPSNEQLLSINFHSILDESPRGGWGLNRGVQTHTHVRTRKMTVSQCTEN